MTSSHLLLRRRGGSRERNERQPKAEAENHGTYESEAFHDDEPSVQVRRQLRRSRAYAGRPERRGNGPYSRRSSRQARSSPGNGSVGRGSKGWAHSRACATWATCLMVRRYGAEAKG